MVVDPPIQKSGRIEQNTYMVCNFTSGNNFTDASIASNRDELKSISS